MKSPRLLKTVLSTLIILSLCTEITAALPDAAIMKMDENFNQGNITLFSQNYSETSHLPENVFIGKLQSNKLYDKIYLEVYGKSESQDFLELISKQLLCMNYIFSFIYFYEIDMLYGNP